MAVKIKMEKTSGEDVRELSGNLLAVMSREAELVTENHYEGSDMKVSMMVFEKFYFRTSSYAGLTILLTEIQGQKITLDIVGSGGGGGLLNISWGSNRSFAEKAQRRAEELGFVKLSEE